MADDAVRSAFDYVREQARTRGNVPDLTRQGRSRVPRRSAAKSLSDVHAPESVHVPGIDVPDVDKRPKSIGHPTGPDGRALCKPYTVSSMGQLIGTEIAQRGWQHELAHGWVSGHWQSLVGEQIAAHTRVRMVKNSTVFISCTSTAWATNLKYMQKTILAEIARRVGDGIVTDLKIFGPQAPSWRKGPLHVKGRGPRDTFG